MTNHQLEQLVEAAIAAESASAAGGQSAAWTPPHVSEAGTLARLIDHTLLKPEAGEEQIRALCADAATWGFASVCVHPTWVPLCTELLGDSQAKGKLPGVVKVCTVIGFPLGATLPAVKAYEVEQVAQLGAQEVDMVLNVGRLRDGDFWAVYRDILAVVDAARDNGLLLKVIIETGLLNQEQKIAACVIAKEAGADDVIIYTRQDFAAETKRITGGKGVQVVYDSVGKSTFLPGFDVIAPRGMMVLFGGSSGPVDPFDPQILNRKGSLFLSRPSLGAYIATREELLERAGELFRWIAGGKLSVRIGAEFPLAEAAEAQRALEGRQTTGKVILRVPG